jgi:8-oxo-dGTP pyrophosphatase MutT (NUDIX family)
MGKKVHAAGIFLMRKDFNILICHPTNHAPNVWSIPKGKIEEGEGAMEAAIRETYEETNVNLNDKSLNVNDNFNIHEFDIVNYGHKKKDLHPFLFLELQTSNIDWDSVKIKCNSNVPIERGGFPEMDGYKWVTLKEAKELLHDTQVACIGKIIDIIR